MELERPRPTPVLPESDLGVVMETLSKPSSEPLQGLSKAPQHKTVFLLAMASAGRCCELQSLVFNPKCLQFKPQGSGVTLYFWP